MMPDLINEKQMRIAGLLIRSFRLNYNHSDKKIKSDEIIFNLKQRSFKIEGGELREIIGHIRRNDLCAPEFILSNGEGYWLSNDVEEMATVWESEFGRAKKILQNFAQLRRRVKHLKSELTAIL